MNIYLLASAQAESPENNYRCGNLYITAAGIKEFFEGDRSMTRRPLARKMSG